MNSPKPSSPLTIQASSPSLWHPYCQMQTMPAPLKVVKTAAEFLYLENGERLIDGVASWWTACHGYNHPHIIQRVKEQLECMSHVMLGGLVHEPALQLAEKLTNKLPGNLAHIFFSDSGSTAVEVALKIAVQYWRNRGFLNRTKFIAFHQGYHGDTLGAMSVSDPEQVYHKAFKTYVPQQCFLPLPTSEAELAHFDRYLSIYRSQIAGLIMEPLVQGAGGMRIHSPAVLKAIYERCKAHKVLLLLDEVFTGFGRTGSFFACEQADVQPDILILSKALTGGVMGMGATAVTSTIFEKFLSKHHDHAFMHGPTFMANPLACSAALANLEVFEKEGTLKRVREIEHKLKRAFIMLGDKFGVREIRILGALAAIELTQLDHQKVQQIALKHGVWLRPIGNVLYTTPPLNISDESLATIIEAMKAIVKAHRS